MGVVAILVLVVFAIVAFGAYSSSTKDDTDAHDALRPDLPFRYSLTFEKKLIGRSRKGVIDYYKHYVRAILTTQERGDVENQFPFDHHDQADRIRACNVAREWLYAENAKEDAVAKSSPVLSQEDRKNALRARFPKNPDGDLDRYGRPIKRD